MDVLKINGASVPAPAAVEVSISDIDSEDAGRDMNGTMYRNRIAVKRKLTCSWNALGSRDMARLLQAVRGQFLDISYHDPESGQMETRTFYAGDRTTPVYSMRGNEIIWQSVNMSFVER